MSTEKWNKFMSFAALFADTVDLDVEEYNYKVALAERLKKTRAAYIAGDPEWFEMLRKDISSTNLMNQYFMMRLVDLGRTRPDDLRKIIDLLWIGEPDVEKIDDFTEQLRPYNPEQFSVGGIVGFASILLLGRDPHAFPPYRARAVKKFLKLVDWTDRGANGMPAERYQLLLDALDEMIRLAPNHDITLRDRLDAQGLLWTVMNIDPSDDWSSEQIAGFRQWRGDKEPPVEVDLSVPAVTAAPDIEVAGRRIIETGFRGGPSPIDDATSTWSAENARDLERRGGLDVGPGKFMEQFQRQLNGADRGTILLAAELAYLQVLPLTNVSANTKLARVNTILSWIEDSQVSLPPGLREGLEATGTFNGGIGFNIQVAEHLQWLCRLVADAATQPMSRVDEALNDPWAFQAMTQSVPGDRPMIRYSIDYLAWPGYLPPVVNNDHRIDIWKAFAGIIGGVGSGNSNDEPSIAKDLHGIRLVQQGNTNQFVEWYREPYLGQWRRGSEDAGQRAWLVRQSQAGTAMLQPWLEDGFVSTPAQHLGSPMPGSTLNQIQTAINKGYQHIEYSERKLRATEYHRFLSVMKVDDYVLTAFEDNLYLGVVTGEAHYVVDASSRLRHAVAWQKTPISNTDVPAPLPRLLAEQGSVVDLTEALSIITAWYGDDTDVNDATEDAAPTPQIAVVPQLRQATPELARRLNVSQEHLQEVIRLLQTRQQFVFYGPPGTGKTYLGTAIAKFLVGEEHTDHVKMVQFHPSYAYEDFFEGYRPAKSQDGTVGFSLEAGPLRRIADEAASEGNRDKPYFLIIDEMNRGNLAKVFGELYYLLEYRSEGINLQYNPEKVFALPPNLFIIGTMNTSDRSIAMVDAAIRRRFAFVELHPQEGMISGLLERFLAANGKPSLRADLLNALNNEIEDTNRDLMIGPSYFMKPHAETDEGLEEIWKYELLPLLEEQYFGRLKRNQVREKFGLAAMRLKASALIGPVDLSLASGEPALDAEGTEELEQPLTDSEDTST